jgi:hypothetical protein
LLTRVASLALLITAGAASATPSGAPAATPARTNGFAELSRAYVALAVQGDLRPVPALFEQSVGAGAAGAALRDQFTERFLDPARPFTDELADTDPAAGVALAWRAYWRRHLLRESIADMAETELTGALASLLPAESVGTTPHGLTRELLAPTGWHYSLAAAPPWRDLFVWKTERHAKYEVELTDTTLPVEVVFMDDFVVQGWKDFASLGLASTTGWVENGRLYCVAWAYDVDSENFAVSYLKHEARHLADLRRFPDMASVDLEYRAKLTELAFARSDLPRIWNDFVAKAVDNPASPHAQANWRVVRAVEAELAGGDDVGTAATAVRLDPARINRVAAHLLRQHSIRYEPATEAAAR